MRNNRITQSIVVGLTTLLAAFSWSGLYNILSGGNSWLLPSICFLILLVFLSLSLLLLESKSILTISLATILISFFFPFGFKLEYLIVLTIAFFLLFFGSFRIISEKELRIKLKIFRILKCGLPLILTGLSMIIAIAYFFSPLSIQEDNKIEIPRQLFDITIQPIVNILLDKDISIPEAPTSEEISDILYTSINQEINKRSEVYKDYFSIGFAIGVFFAVKFISIFFMWLVILISWIIFKILLSLNAIKIQEKSVLKEVIET